MAEKVNGVLTEYNRPFILQRADPYVYRHENGSYYFTASVPEYDRIILRRAESLKDLGTAEEKTIWVKHESGHMSRHIWAPELHYLDGKWFIYFAAGMEEDKWAIRPYVLECTGIDPVNDGWVERGQMQASADDNHSFTGFSLDATVFEHKGVSYFVWAEKPAGDVLVSNLYIAPMESPCRLAAPPKLLTTPEYDWEKVDFLVNEGPAVLKHGNRIFLTFSASGTGACYCMGLMSVSGEDDVMDMDAWHKRPKPVFATDPSRGIYGPGHNSFTRDEDGVDICVFHARTYEEIVGDPLYDRNRHTMLMKVRWDDKGEPVFVKDTGEI